MVFGHLLWTSFRPLQSSWHVSIVQCRRSSSVPPLHHSDVNLNLLWRFVTCFDYPLKLGWGYLIFVLRFQIFLTAFRRICNLLLLVLDLIYQLARWLHNLFLYITSQMRACAFMWHRGPMAEKNDSCLGLVDECWDVSSVVCEGEARSTCAFDRRLEYSFARNEDIMTLRVYLACLALLWNGSNQTG